MKLYELFHDDDAHDVMGQLRTDIIDVLLPLVANGVSKVSIEQLVAKLKEKKSGIYIDRSIVTKILDPNNVKLVKKIEGDDIYFKVPDNGEVRKVDDFEKDKEKKRMSDKAKKQAKKEIKRDT